MELFLCPLGSQILERSNEVFLGDRECSWEKKKKSLEPEPFFRSPFHKVFSSRQLTLRISYELKPCPGRYGCMGTNLGTSPSPGVRIRCGG